MTVVNTNSINSCIVYAALCLTNKVGVTSASISPDKLRKHGTMYRTHKVGRDGFSGSTNEPPHTNGKSKAKATGSTYGWFELWLVQNMAETHTDP